MDSALVLKKRLDSGEEVGMAQAQSALADSMLLAELLSDFDFNILNLLNRLTEIAEIPLASSIEQVRKWTSTLADMSFAGDGFSITGKSNDILSCYNSMVVSVLLRFGYHDTARIKAGVEWILRYQNFSRGEANRWSGTWVKKYGGCLKSTPCYIGVVKAAVALTDYKKYLPPQHSLPNADMQLQQALEYILSHNLYKRQNSDEPITPYISKLTYPFSNNTNVVEILRLMQDNGLAGDSRCNAAKQLIRTKQHSNGYWRVNSSYLPKCWVLFDKPREQGCWLSHEIEKLIW